MRVFTLSLGELGANCYLVADEKGDGAVIDPGSEPERILEEVKRQGLNIRAILLTHGHFDHIMAAEEIREKLQIPLYLHEADGKMLTDKNANLLEGFRPGADFAPVREYTPICDGEEISAGSFQFQVLHTPGHSMGSCCFLCKDALFTGDTLFAGSIGRTDFMGGDSAAMTGSLKRISSLSGDFKIYPGHGGETTLSRERRQNIFLSGLEDY